MTTAEAHKEEVMEINWFNELSKVDISPYVERKGGKGFSPSYISWASAWGLMNARDPHASFEYIMYKDVIDGVEYDVPYIKTPFGYSVEVAVTFKGKTNREQLPVMDHRFNAIMKPTIRDINDAQKRCLAKCIASHGLGLSLYVKDGIPSDFENDHHKDNKPEGVQRQTASELNVLVASDKTKNEIKSKIVEIAALTLGGQANQNEMNEEIKKIFARYKIGKDITEELAKVKLAELQKEIVAIHDARMKPQNAPENAPSNEQQEENVTSLF